MGARRFPFSVNDHGLLSGLQGATIRRDDATGAVIVARIMRGGAADRSGKSSFFLAVCQSTTTDQHRVKLFSSYLMIFRVGKSEKQKITQNLSRFGIFLSHKGFKNLHMSRGNQAVMSVMLQ